MPKPPLIVIHERIGNWHRQLRPRFLAFDESIRWRESRSLDDLVHAIAGEVCPMIVVDGAGKVFEPLEAIEVARRSAPGALILWLDPSSSEEAAAVAREAGASHVIAGRPRPPYVFESLKCWLPIARGVESTSGWSKPLPATTRPWEAPAQFAAEWLSRARWAGARPTEEHRLEELVS